MEVLVKKAEADLANSIITQVKEADNARERFKRQALINVMFLYGNHHFTLSQRRPRASDNLMDRINWEIESFQKDSAAKKTSNYILPLFRSIYARLIRMKAHISATPTTSLEEDREAARVTQEVANNFWDTCNSNNPWAAQEYRGMPAVLMKLFLYEMTLGCGYLEPYFNPKAKSLAYDAERKKVFEADIGEAEARVHSLLNVFRDPFGRHIITRRLISPEQVYYEFNKKVKSERQDEDTVEDQIARTLDGDQANDSACKDGIYVYTKYCVPSVYKDEDKKDEDYPSGRKIVCTSKEILADEDLPTECRGNIPMYEFRYQDLGFSNRGQGCIEQVVDLQQEYNNTLTRIAQFKKLMTGKLMVPRGSKISAKWNDEVGQVIFYAQGHKPGYEQAPSVPAYFFEEIKRIREEMENLMNSHDVSMGRTPGQVKSGVGIENLTELDNSMISPELIMLEQKISHFTENVINICQEKYNERRLIAISGEDLAPDVKSFIGSDLVGQKRITVKIGSSMPENVAQRQQYIMMLRDKGYISTERAKELLEFGDIDGVYKSLDETAAKNDILNIINNNYEVIAEPWEDHTIFLKIINDFRKTQRYMLLPEEIKQRINQWAGQHQDMLLNEQETAKQMGGGLPPAAKTQPQ